MGNLFGGTGPRGPVPLFISALILILAGLLFPTPLPAQSPPGGGTSTEEGLFAVCDQAAAAFLSSFRQELDQALDQGPEAGAGFFRERLAGLEQGFSNPRISLGLMGKGFGRLSGQDVFDRTAISGFARAGERSAGALGFFIDPEGRGRVYRFFREVRAEASCLACHGPREEIAAATRAALEKAFPDFDGHGFAEGDLLGVVGIRVANPPLD